MTSLLDLPSELLLVIAKLLLYTRPEKIYGKIPFYQLHHAFRHAFDHNQPRRIKDIHSLLLTTRRLKALLEPVFYRDVFVREFDRYGSKQPWHQLQESLDNNPGLRSHIFSAMIPCVSRGGDSFMQDGYQVFWFPNLTTLTLHNFRDWEELEFDDNSHVCTSPVEHLRLIQCGAHEKALKALISWPWALRTLLYDADQCEWSGHYEDQPAKEWTCEAFVRALQSQKENLEDLIMTRPMLDHEGLFHSPPIDLRDFLSLRTLQIYHAFLCGWTPTGSRLSERLPPSLEVLEVYYDDIDMFRFVDGDRGDPNHDDFIDSLLMNKRQDLPKLHTVKIYSPELMHDSDVDGELEEEPWKLPASLAHDASEAGIKIEVRVGCLEVPNCNTDIFRSLEVSLNR